MIGVKNSLDLNSQPGEAGGHTGSWALRTAPFLGRDPLGYDANDANLYRYVGNDPTGATDPSGLIEVIASEKSASFSWRNQFGADESLQYRRGCVGLCSIRTGSYKSLKLPNKAAGVHLFWKLEDALVYQKGLGGKDGKTAVLFAVESKNDFLKSLKPLGESKTEIDPASVPGLDKLEPYDFATAFQNHDGSIAFWERMPWGERKNPDLVVLYTKGHSYKNVIYGVVETDSKFAPFIVDKDPRPHPARGKGGVWSPF